MALVQTRLHSIDVIDGETLLETLERVGYDIEFQCREGFCGSCRTKVISGEVVYLRDPIAYIGTGEVLPCCCQAKDKLLLDLGEDEYEAGK
ncbi:class I ribonucleotide reductase maintenance protein YfaE [Basilea psittacipulmonis]|uniref:2Fe-2S ferredoxin-type domain-containing protein n=1 Tax=Basilea psittacipulmonis DSM 24701 TaxID=1072685 RepID=A0A077DFQ9_9BURK|nr:class I ribonucleotide reductase maintenance protein YfaE [Basilea psittacipulmonis]AIL33021.1 hypothetical protein IX83_06575 [Basilea psittacipulmonis DSM 24701]